MLHNRIQTVVPATYFASTGTLRRRSGGDMKLGELATAPPSRNDDITPSELRSLYRRSSMIRPQRTGIGKILYCIKSRSYSICMNRILFTLNPSRVLKCMAYSRSSASLHSLPLVAALDFYHFRLRAALTDRTGCPRLLVTDRLIASALDFTF